MTLARGLFFKNEQAELIALQGQFSKRSAVDGGFLRPVGWRDNNQFLQRHASRLGTAHDAARVKHPVGVKFHPFLTDRCGSIIEHFQLQSFQSKGNQCFVNIFSRC